MLCTTSPARISMALGAAMAGGNQRSSGVPCPTLLPVGGETAVVPLVAGTRLGIGRVLWVGVVPPLVAPKLIV